MSAAQSKGAPSLVKSPIRLKVIRNSGETIMDQIFQTTPIRLGRMLDNDVALPFDFVSRYHCELRHSDKGWGAFDLGSKNGFLTESVAAKAVRLERINELKIENGSTFFIQELAITIEILPEVSADDHFASQRPDTGTLIDPEVKAELEKSGRTKRKGTQAAEPSEPMHEDPTGPLPMVDVDLQTLLFIPHRGASQAREKALQMTTVWQDQVLDAKEFAVGEPITWDYNGDSHDLGRVDKERAIIRVPRGCQAAEGAILATANKSDKTTRVTATLETPTAFNVSASIFVYFRYVPKSKDLPQTSQWIDDKLLDPLVISSAIHGTIALSTFVVHPKHVTPERNEPERFATVIMPKPPEPVQVAVQPTPVPTPEPTPLPTPEPKPEPEKKIAKKEPEPPKIKKVSDEKKHKKVALKRKEEAAPKVAVQKPEPKPVPKAVAQAAPPPPAPKAVAPAPAPFVPKNVGALKSLALLHASPSAKIANVQNIQVARVPSSASTSTVDNKDAAGTSDIISNLNKSAITAAGGTGDGTGVAVGGKKAGGSYGVGGLSGKTGKHNIKGSVLGGATYTELSKNEGLTREQVMKVVTKHQSEIQQCYERSLMSNPDLSGSAEFEWDIAGAGNVTSVKVRSATLKNGEMLLDCVKGVFTKMAFPKAKNGESTSSTITLPFGRL